MGYRYGGVCVILRLAILVQCRIDRWTEYAYGTDRLLYYAYIVTL